jgi:hypothetical protein
MTDDLSVIVLPDAAAVSSDSILYACLYFDKVYLHAFEPVLTAGEGGKTLKMKLKQAHLDSWLRPLREAGIVGQTCGVRTGELRGFTSQELPLALREAIAASLSAGADLLTTTLLSRLDGRAGPLLLPYTPVFENPGNLNNAQFELAVCSHLISTLEVLAIGQNSALTPFTGHMSHAHLLTAIARAFPMVAKSLGLNDADLLAARHAAFAQSVLEETLPVVRVRVPEDILGLRETLQDELQRFRAEIGKLATSLTKNPGDEPFRAEALTLAAKEIRPAIADLRRKLAKPGRRIAKYLISDWTTVASGSALPMAAILMKSAQLPWAILGGLCAGLGLAALKARVEEWSTKESSAFTFVIEAERRLR